MANIKDIHNYDDIFDRPYIKSKRHPPMSNLERAAQFAPFSALTGHKESIDETERMTDKKRILDESQIDILNRKLNKIMLDIKQHPKIKITYFKSDIKKRGGKYIIMTNRVKKIDEYYKVIIMQDNTKIPIKDIYKIDEIE